MHLTLYISKTLDNENLRSSEPLDQVNLRLSGILRLSEPLGYVNFRFSGNP